MRRVVEELRGLYERRRVERAQPGTHRFPRHPRRGERALRARLYAHLRFGTHHEGVVRHGDEEVQGPVAVVVLALGELVRRGRGADAVRLAALPGERARAEVQKLLRDDRGTGIAVLRVVNDV